MSSPCFGKVDYEKLSNKLVGNGTRGRTYVFDALPPQGHPNKDAKQGFLDKLRYLESFQVELGYIKNETKICPNCTREVNISRQKKVDILMATRLLERAAEADRVVLVAGDGDFVPAVEVARKKTKIVLAFARHGRTDASTQLKQACDSRIQMDAGYFSDCLLSL